MKQNRESVLKFFNLVSGLFYLFSYQVFGLEPNRAELSLPFIEEKLVIAHYMTAQIYAENGANNPASSLSFYDPKGSVAHLGGWSQVAPMDLFLYKKENRQLEDAVDLEIQKAIKLGIDGFQFYYVNHSDQGFMENYNRIIKTFFKIAEQKYPNFKLTLCLCNASGTDEDKQIKDWSLYIKDILAETRDSKNWLKTPDGRYVFYTWSLDGIAGVTGGKHYRIFKRPD